MWARRHHMRPKPFAAQLAQQVAITLLLRNSVLDG
jgi:hypothetical protein